MDYTKYLSEKALVMKPSGIRKFFDMLSGMKDVISLTVGQPDFPTPYHISNAAVESITKNKTYYTSNSGLPELREGIANYLDRRFDLHYDAMHEIIVTVGGSEDISYMINRVMEQGGHATMFRELTQSPAPAHNRKYDFKEDAMVNGVKAFCASVYDIMK